MSGTTPDRLVPLGHAPVMLAEVMASLAPRDGAAYLDGTFGGGGYASAILDAASCTLWAIDRDPDAIARGAALAARHPGRLHLIEGSFGSMLALLREAGVQRLDGVVLDLGVSSFQLDDPRRGFSFRTDGPLDMRMAHDGATAADLVNRLDEAELADTLYQLGEERLSRRIAKAIVAARAEAPITTTARLAGIIRAVVPPDRSGIDPATRSFQALRIRVNDELGEITRGLEQAAQLLGPGGRLVVVAFHSLEDRLVKRFMVEATGRAAQPSRHDPAGLLDRKAPAWRLLTPRALRPGPAETHANPRARSARLRAMERLGPDLGRCRHDPTRDPGLRAAGGRLGTYLYQTKHQAQLLDRQIHRVREATDATLSRAGLLRAEYARLNDPDRLEELAAAYLADLRPTQPQQWTTMAEMDRRLPPVGAPTQDPTPLEQDAAPMARSEPEQQPAAPRPPLVASAPAQAPTPAGVQAETQPVAPKPAPAVVAHVAPKPIVVRTPQVQVAAAPRALPAAPVFQPPAVSAPAPMPQSQVAHSNGGPPLGAVLVAGPALLPPVSRPPVPAPGQMVSPPARYYAAASRPSGHADFEPARPASAGLADPPIVASSLGMARTSLAANPASSAKIYQAGLAR